MKKAKQKLNKSNKFNRNYGFTLVELLVVISIISTLATVFIIGYKGFTEKAKVSNDSSLTIEINTILQSEETLDDKNNTVHDVLEDLYDNGIDESELTPSSKGHRFIWDSTIDRIALLNDKDEVVAPESYTLPEEKYTCFEFVDYTAYSITENSFTDDFSHYLVGDWSSISSITTSTGIDVGDATNIAEIVYINDDPDKNVIIRANSVTTNIGINNIGYITLYGTVGKIVGVTNNLIDYTIGATIGNPGLYITSGTNVVYLKIASGYVVIDNDVYITLLYATSDNVKVTSEGNIEHAHATDEETADSLNSEEKTKGFIYDYDDNEEQVESKGNNVTDHSDDTSYDPDNDDKVEEIINEEKDKSDETEETSSDPIYNVTTKTYYTDLSSAISAIPENTKQTIKLKNDISITSNKALEINNNQILVLDLNGHTLRTIAEEADFSHSLLNYGTLTIKDSTDNNKDGTGKGAIISSATQSDQNEYPNYTSETITNLGTLTIESGLIENTSKGSLCFAIDNQTNSSNYTYTAKCTVNGGKILQDNDNQYAFRMYGNSSTNMNKTIINGGSIEGGYALWMDHSSNVSTNMMSLIINGGKLISHNGKSLYIGAEGSGNRIDFSNTTIQIKGGEIGDFLVSSASKRPYDFAISGGNFDSVEAGTNLPDFITGGTFKKSANDDTWVKKGWWYASYVLDWIKANTSCKSISEYCQLSKDYLADNHFYYFQEHDYEGTEAYDAYYYHGFIENGYKAIDNDDGTYTVVSDAD